jgi:hypothetical protein
MEQKAFHVTGRGGPLCCGPSRSYDFLDNRLTDGGEDVSLAVLSPQEDSWKDSVK